MTKEEILICAVIYNEKIENTNIYNSLLKYNIENVYIYDNSTDETIDNSKFDCVRYHRDMNNPGLSYAYNNAAKFASNNGYHWILLCDQDTVFMEYSLDGYVSAINAYPDIKLFIPQVKTEKGIPLSPRRTSHYFNMVSKELPQGKINPLKYSIINSGLLIDVSAFFNSGGYNDAVKLDFADFQFIERFGQVYDSAYVTSVNCIQSFSDEEHSTAQKLSRFSLFCESLKNYKTTKRSGRFWLNLIILKRALSISVAGGGFSPFSIILKKYIK